MNPLSPPKNNTHLWGFPDWINFVFASAYSWLKRTFTLCCFWKMQACWTAVALNRTLVVCAISVVDLFWLTLLVFIFASHCIMQAGIQLTVFGDCLLSHVWDVGGVVAGGRQSRQSGAYLPLFISQPAAHGHPLRPTPPPHTVIKTTSKIWFLGPRRPF